MENEHFHLTFVLIEFGPILLSITTGCNSGFGKAAAKYFDSIGAYVFAICYSGDSGEHELIATCSGKLTPIQLDITKDDQVRKVARTVRGMLGDRGEFNLGYVEQDSTST